MAETLLRTQSEDGSWPACVDGRTGAVIGKYSTSVAAVISLFERVNELQPDPRWSRARDPSLAWMEKIRRFNGWNVCAAAIRTTIQPRRDRSWQSKMVPAPLPN